MKTYYGEWESGGFVEMVSAFADIYMTKDEFEAEKAPYANNEYWVEQKSRLQKALADPAYTGEVLFAGYWTGGYEGDAFVLFKREGKLFEVNGSHCSCYGLEGQWGPEETTKEAIQHRLEHSTYGALGEFKDEVRAALERA